MADRDLVRPKIPTYAWVLPRPKADRYPGGFPLHFERKLIRLLGDPCPILHSFGGMAEFGVRVDLLRRHPWTTERSGGSAIWRPPDVIGDAHRLPFQEGVFGLVVTDPPYSDEEGRRLYGTPPVRYAKYVQEAVRVCRPGGFVACYHVVLTPRPAGTVYHSRILLATRVFHRLRACCVFQKVGG